MGKKKETPAPAPAAPAASAGGGMTGPYDQVLQGYSQFANTGGFSPQDLQNIRARSIAPIRANYANAVRDVDRQRALQGGYSPGYGVLRERMQRAQGQGQAEATTNAEAGISEMVQKGKLAGLEGLSGLIDRGGGGGGGEDNTPVPEQKKGFWGKFGGALKKVGQVALPIALGTGPIGLSAGAAAKLGKGLGKVGLAAKSG